MAKRKREIQKRKKIQEQTPPDGESSAVRPDEADGQRGSAAPGGAVHDERTFAEPPMDDSQILRTEPSPAGRSRAAEKAGRASKDSWLAQNKENFLLGLLILYVLLLGLGTAGELFEIEWILNLPLFR